MQPWSKVEILLREEDPDTINDVDTELQQPLRTSQEHSHELEERIQYAFGEVPELDLRPFNTSAGYAANSIVHSDESLVAEQKHIPSASCVVVQPDESLTGHQLLWTPRNLHWASLTVFGLVYVLMIPMLEVLHYFSRENNGLNQADPRDYYLWTYGPTAGMNLPRVNE